ncbi:disease resistance protein [Senna tora]|uniref:Disease resistance protein n=1 Tax=Senna tora TaxID=362788 RepID=A0A835C7Z0_9FABA|nr:disease resistance protein [Senna tora]
MGEIVLSIVAKLAEYLVEPTIQQGRYLFCGATIKRNFESEKEKLLSTQEGVQKLVEEARHRTDTIANAVATWLNNVDSLIKDMDDLEREIKEKKSCFGMWSPNWPSYCLSKQMAAKIKTMVQLNANHEFNPFSHRTPIQDTRIVSSENFIQHGCKLLLTTRREQVCTWMGCEKKIPLDLLSENEAWSLFNKHACINDITSQGVAREVAKECKGLPIALVAMGSCIKDKDQDGINVVLHKLKHAERIDLDDGDKDVFRVLKFSYDYLKDKESKLLFLMCAVFPEDHRIKPEDLFRYGIGLNVRAQVDSFEMARSCVNDAINCLIESSLLMRDNDTNGAAFYKMHDMVRDVALWIATKENRTIVVNHATRQNSSLEDGPIRDCYALSCWNMDRNLPQQLDAPKLEMLLLNIEARDLDFSLPSFEGFKRMKVMAIMNHIVLFGRKTSLTLSHSTHLLTNLHTLRLVGMNLDDISFVVSLRSLEILDFRKSALKELPNGLEKLNKLKLLDLSKSKIDGHCYEVIKRCLQLEELYVYREYRWGGDGFNNSNTFCLEDATFSKLQRYQLEVGEIGTTIFDVSLCKRSLFIEGLNVSTSGANIKDLLRRAIKVGLKMLKGGCKNVIPELVQAIGGMNELIGLYLQSCSEIECVFNTTSLMASSLDASIVVQSLLLIQELQIEDCYELKYIMKSGVSDNNYKGKQIVAVPDNSCLYFSRLKKLHIHSCWSLEYIFPISVVQRLEQLEEISIKNAPHVKYLFSEPDHEYHSSSQNEIQIVLPHLKVVGLLRLLNLVNIFPESYQYRLSWTCLTEFCWVDCPKLTIDWIGSTYNKVNLEQRQSFLNKGLEGNATNDSKSSNEISALSCVDFVGGAMDLCFFPEIVNPVASILTQLTLGNLPELRHIWMGSAELLSLQCLKELEVYNCGKLKSLLSPVVQRSLPQLKTIKIRSCEQIEDIFGCEKIKDISTNKKKEIALPNLIFLTLEKLPNFVDICQGFTFHAVKLVEVTIDECPKFAPFLTANQEISIGKSKKGEAHEMQTDLQAILNVNEGEGATMVSNLGFLELKNIAEMEFIWKGPTLITFQHLLMLKVEGCKKLRSIFSSAVSLPVLHELNIINCEELEEIISLSEEEANFPNPSSTSHPQHPFFPMLLEIHVKGCNRLRCVFPLSISPYHLPSLFSLRIRRCSLVEQVFGCAPQNHHHHDAEMMEFQLPKLVFLTLEELPSLTNFCRYFEYHLKLEALKTCEVRDCPKFSSTTIPALHKFITHTGIACHKENISCSSLLLEIWKSAGSFIEFEDRSQAIQIQR